MSLNRGKLAPVVLALGVLIGCQGSDADESLDATPTSYAAVMTYGGDVAHPVTADTEDPVSLLNIAELEKLVNDHRTSLGLDGLQILPELRRLAQAHSVHMGTHEPAFFDHLNPEGDRPEARALAEGIEAATIGENIAAGLTAAEGVFRSWLDSPAHRANLEDPRWTHMGVGYACLPGSTYGVYWTLDLLAQDEHSAASSELEASEALSK